MTVLSFNSMVLVGQEISAFSIESEKALGFPLGHKKDAIETPLLAAAVEAIHKVFFGLWVVFRKLQRQSGCCFK